MANGKLINSLKGKTVEVKVVKGIGKGSDKEFIQVIFSEKPSQSILDSLKLKGFHYFNQDKSWSAYKTDSKMAFAESLIEDKKADKKADKPASGKGKRAVTESKQEDKLDLILAKLNSFDERITALENKGKKKTSK